MSVVYSGLHSIDISFVDGSSRIYNTWTDWHLIPTTRPYIAIPKPIINIVPIPGTNKFIDLTSITPGGYSYDDISGQWNFYIDHDQWQSNYIPNNGWENAYNTLCLFFNGAKINAVLTDDPHKQYSGRISVSGYNSGDSYSTISLNYIFKGTYTSI